MSVAEIKLTHSWFIIFGQYFVIKEKAVDISIILAFYGEKAPIPKHNEKFRTFSIMW